MENVKKSISSAIDTYHELNASVVDELHEEPSPLEFLRFVHKNRPFVVRRAAAEWEAVKKWNSSYLTDVMAGQSVQVAVTPLGCVFREVEWCDRISRVTINSNADAIVKDENGDLLFVTPHETSEDFKDFLEDVQRDSGCSAEANGRRNVKYAQTQNDNLRDEYDSLFKDVPPEISFASIALEQEADAINLWIGNERSVTALHKDNYENIYVQVRGKKHFTLLPPIEMPCVNERPLPIAKYEPTQPVAGRKADALTVMLTDGTNLVPVATWDPDEPGERTTAWSDLAKPLSVTLREGDMLYLPAMWYHKVRQTAGEEGFACAVNYWYDMSFAGGFWTANSFLRDVTLAVEGGGSGEGGDGA